MYRGLITVGAHTWARPLLVRGWNSFSLPLAPLRLAEAMPNRRGPHRAATIATVREESLGDLEDNNYARPPTPVDSDRYRKAYRRSATPPLRPVVVVATNEGPINLGDSVKRVESDDGMTAHDGSETAPVVRSSAVFEFMVVAQRCGSSQAQGRTQAPANAAVSTRSPWAAGASPAGLLARSGVTTATAGMAPRLVPTIPAVERGRAAGYAGRGSPGATRSYGHAEQRPGSPVAVPMVPADVAFAHARRSVEAAAREARSRCRSPMASPLQITDAAGPMHVHVQDHHALAAAEHGWGQSAYDHTVAWRTFEVGLDRGLN